MQNQLFIPSKIKAGFQKRDDTYTKKLAYVIYWDSKGVLRKETSWKGWRDDKIEPMDLDNAPHSGFVLNKSVKRDSSWFGNGRNMIRIYDDRGIEFEITTGNLLFILMTTNCHKRGLEGEFVYAWYGTELVLLPVNCEEYQNSTEFTSLQGNTISAKSLIQGAVYENKRQEKYTYIGKFDWYDFAYSSAGMAGVRKKSKRFIFADDGQNIVSYRDIKSFSRCVTETPVMEFPTLMEKFCEMPQSCKFVDIVDTGKTRKLSRNKIDSWSYYDPETFFFIYDQQEDVYKKHRITREQKYDYVERKYTHSYRLVETNVQMKLVEGEDIVKIYIDRITQNRPLTFNVPYVRDISPEELDNYQVPVYMAVLSNGKKVDLNKI